ncbi:spidroin-1-like [Panthera pardus]|uniref:Spidroin-1-like n=1 Tax=Panthera pardus TaxID=9691 RepID=A0A9W2VD56_PANPR|nr:spidroin-1-like [Panthera pardus]
MLLPFPAPSERRGVGEAGPSRCTEETPSRGRTGPAAGALGPARGWPEHGAEVGPAGPSSLTPGDPALRRATAALAQAAWPSGCVTVTGRLGQRAAERERGASPYCLWGGAVVVLCGGSGGGSPPSRERWGRAAGAAGRQGAGSQRRSLCVRARACGRGGRARRRILACAQARAAGRARAQEEGPRGAGAVGRREGGRADAKGGGEPRRRRRARAIRGRRIRACARRGVSALEGSDACAFTCALESGKKRREAWRGVGVEASRRRGGGAAPAQCAAELCVCESLTGSKWRRLLQRLLLCEGNNTPPRRQRRRRRRLRLAEHLPSGWACRRSVYPGQGALREEGQRQGAHPPESLLCDWGVAGGSSRSAEPRLRGRREGSPGPQPGAPRRSRPLRPPGPGPAFRGAGAARGTSGRPVSADRPPLLGSGGGRAAACLGHGEEGAPRGRGLARGSGSGC